MGELTCMGLAAVLKEICQQNYPLFINDLGLCLHIFFSVKALVIAFNIKEKALVKFREVPLTIDSSNCTHQTETNIFSYF